MKRCDEAHFMERRKSPPSYRKNLLLPLSFIHAGG